MVFRDNSVVHMSQDKTKDVPFVNDMDKDTAPSLDLRHYGLLFFHGMSFERPKGRRSSSQRLL